MLIDTHCHLFESDYDNLDEVIKRMPGIMITAGIGDESNQEVLKMIDKYDNIYGVLGIHPEEIEKISDDSFAIIEANINNPKIVGIGEIGLDYYWVRDNKEKQKELFEKQIFLARKYHKPIVVHNRDAHGDILDIIKRNPDISYVLHCFSGSVEMARELLKYNVMFGIGGVSTFDKYDKLKEVIKEIGLEYLLLETDSPYLTPVPYRGKKNEPAYTDIIAAEIAKIKGITKEEVIQRTCENAIREFDLPIQL